MNEQMVNTITRLIQHEVVQEIWSQIHTLVVIAIGIFFVGGFFAGFIAGIIFRR